MAEQLTRLAEDINAVETVFVFDPFSFSLNQYTLTPALSPIRWEKRTARERDYLTLAPHLD